MKNEIVFQNLLDLTDIFKNAFKCELTFSLVDGEIELCILSTMSYNSYYIKVGYEFKVDDIINKFKNMIISEVLSI